MVVPQSLAVRGGGGGVVKRDGWSAVNDEQGPRTQGRHCVVAKRCGPRTTPPIPLFPPSPKRTDAVGRHRLALLAGIARRAGAADVAVADAAHGGVALHLQHAQVDVVRKEALGHRVDAVEGEVELLQVDQLVKDALAQDGEAVVVQAQRLEADEVVKARVGQRAQHVVVEPQRLQLRLRRKDDGREGRQAVGGQPQRAQRPALVKDGGRERGEAVLRQVQLLQPRDRLERAAEDGGDAVLAQVQALQVRHKRADDKVGRPQERDEVAVERELCAGRAAA